MMKIDNNPTPSLNGIDGSSGTSGLDANAFLTPDSLMFYCESRMRNLDEQIQTQFAKQQKANRASEIISSLTEKVGNIHIKDGKADPGDVAVARAAYDEAIDRAKASGDTNLVNALTDQKASFEQRITKDTQAGQLVDENGQPYNWGQNPYDTVTYMSNPDKFIADHGLHAVNGDIKMQPEELQQVTGDLNNLQKDMNSSSELGMIQLQSLMSQRQQAIQLTTNLIQAVGESAKNVTANVGK